MTSPDESVVLLPRRSVRVRLMVLAAMTAFVLIGRQPGATENRVSDIQSDQTVLFYPTLAHADPDGRSWTVPIHGCVFEPETDSAKRTFTVTAIRRLMGLQLNAQEKLAFDTRLRLFLVDHKRGKTIWVRLGTQPRQVGTSGPNGHFQGQLRLSAADVENLRRTGQIEKMGTGSEPTYENPGKSASNEVPVPIFSDGWLTYQALIGPKDRRLFSGRVLLAGRTGLSVISDIDDTIKITEVRDRRAMLANTFARPFRPVPGMAGLYRRLAAAKATFHYVSGSPWQLYEPLRDFCLAEGLPRGTFHLKLFRMTDSSALNLLGSQEEFKTPLIEEILAALPRRRFAIIGDSGEQDPEIYGRLARSHPQQVAAIFIRNVTGEQPQSDRFRKAFDGVPPDRWRLFERPSELEPLVSRLVETRAADAKTAPSPSRTERP